MSQMSNVIDWNSLQIVVLYKCRTSLVVQMVKNLTAMWEIWFRSLGWEDSLKVGMATHCSILACRIPMDRGAWRTTVMGPQRVGNN